MDSSDNDIDSCIDTDEELQIAFAEGRLEKYRKGLVKPLGVSKESYTNDLLGLKNKTDELNGNLEWLERMDITPTEDKEAESSDGLNEDAPVNHENDFQREMHFVHQAQRAAIIGLEKLTSLGVKITRPQDYFAEMLKTDEQMRKVRQNMVNKQKRIEAAEKAKKLREIKRYGKKVQQEILENRQKDKKETLQAVKDYHKGGDKPSFLKREDDEFDLKIEKEKRSRKDGGKSKRRQNKDARYGLGGRKKYLKKNTAESSADMRSFGRNSRPMAKAKKNNNTKRLGKSRRNKFTNKKK